MPRAQAICSFRQSGSDKVWAGAHDGARFFCAWGRRGAALTHTEQHFADEDAARAHYQRKLAEKLVKGYTLGAFDDPTLGVPPLLAGDAPPPPSAPTTRPVQLTAAHVLPFTDDTLAAALTNPAWGFTEKVNGHRCLLHVAADGTLRAFNRHGQETTDRPAGALALAHLGRTALFDGERMLDARAGAYVIFDLLALDGEDLAPVPYVQRIAPLPDLLATLSPSIGPRLAAETPGGLHVLWPETTLAGKAALFAALAASAAEGVIGRRLDAPYEVGDAKSIRKHKFLASLDTIVLAIKPGLDGGSALLGLLREHDGTLVAIGHVRAGLGATDLAALATALANGERPVLEVTYLPARTVGVTLVEPRATLGVRADKDWRACTTAQFDATKTTLIAALDAYTQR